MSNVTPKCDSKLDNTGGNSSRHAVRECWSLTGFTTSPRAPTGTAFAIRLQCKARSVLCHQEWKTLPAGQRTIGYGLPAKPVSALIAHHATAPLDLFLTSFRA
jgi:hypothetical protein